MKVVGFHNRTIIRNTICDMIAVREQLDNPHSLEGYYLPLESGADFAYLAFMSSIDSVRERLPLYRDVLQSVTMPSIIVWGAQDTTLDGTEAIPLFASDLHIPSDDVEMLADAKHLIMEERPGLIADRVDAFVRRGDGGRN